MNIKIWQKSKVAGGHFLNTLNNFSVFLPKCYFLSFQASNSKRHQLPQALKKLVSWDRIHCKVLKPSPEVNQKAFCPYRMQNKIFFLRVYSLYSKHADGKLNETFWLFLPLLFRSRWELTVREARSKWLHLSMPLKIFPRSGFQRDSVISLQSIYTIKVRPLKACSEWENRGADL